MKNGDRSVNTLKNIGESRRRAFERVVSIERSSASEKKTGNIPSILKSSTYPHANMTVKSIIKLHDILKR